MRRYSLFDRIVGEADKVLRTLVPDVAQASRPSPAADLPEAGLSTEERRQIAGFMRINHTGEVCAQALYQGQALTARLPEVREEMAQAAREEIDHLAWCNDRLAALGAPPSVLNPLWYAMSFGIGAAAGIAGDKWSLGFVAETEQQVCEHLQSHLSRLPLNDLRTRAVLAQMHTDEAQHRDMARAAGAAELPAVVQRAMRAMARVMTATTYHI
ncbi:2-polyprenyl-3-methyl-6-methoxy-1,4-benzoquinone monooxygenase [Amnimonas aquatica]|uniref:3-demethoxyubiquinol 3-hydroxylase n=1 Tax=Amnimonas aquatica TaxID=2094561 RepID=A0A2P6ATJ4_9GAMM|nr:2-polyprenyl-3-methyl-6-methoxy-1,4-benzoquinone monooxygenase [Amnimonas aquatica]PQA47979.1 demethoxyubiquinone hydroxylase family protein [Amnimonas aquatica]